MKKIVRLFPAVAILALFALPVAAQTGHEHHGHDAAAPVNVYAPAMEKMHRDMMVPATGDADVDFMRGMIPHHQGAIDMAKAALEHAKDPEVRKLAEDIVKAQESEIAFMQAWLEKREK